MTIKLYRSVLAGTALAASLLLSGLFSVAKADSDSSLNGLSAQDLVSGTLSVDTAEAALPGVAEAVSAQPETYQVLPERSPVADPLSVAQSSPVSDTFAPLTEAEIRQQLLINPSAPVSRRARPLPASTFLVPNAYGAQWRDVFVGVAANAGGQVRDFDGSASAGFGLGDADGFGAIEINTSIISLDGFAEDGTLGFKLHKVFSSANNLAIAVGWENPIKWGSPSDEPDTYYGVVSSRFDLQRGQVNPMPLTVSLGVGTGAYRSAGAIAADNNDPSVFGAVALRVQPELSVITSWTGSALGIATSAAPFKNPLVLTVGLSDITGNTEDGTRLNASVGYAYTF